MQVCLLLLYVYLVFLVVDATRCVHPFHLCNHDSE